MITANKNSQNKPIILTADWSVEIFGLNCRLVNETDTEFIFKLRSDEQLSRFLHNTEGGIDEQRKWIQLYKEREREGREFYFIFEENGKRMGVYRVYNISHESITIGSWLFAKDASANSSIKADIFVKDFCFEHFPDQKLLFNVRKQNKSVNRYHKRYTPTLIGETDEDYLYELNYENYAQGRTKTLELLEII